MSGIFGRLLLWLTAAAALGIIALLTGAPAALWGLAALLLFSLISAILTAGLGKKWSLQLTAPVIGEKNRPAKLTAQALCASRLPAGTLRCTLLVKNDLTGESQKMTVSLLPGKPLEIGLTTARCGRITISAQRAYAMGLLGIFPWRLTLSARCRITILPDTFDPELNIAVSEALCLDSDAYAPDRPGSDPAEPFQLREYVPGDSLRQIHWKLSSKLDRTIIRENSLPVTRSLLVFWDKTGAAAADDMDAQAEVFSSVCQALCQQGYLFTLGWTGPEQAEYIAISTMEELLQALPMVLREKPDRWPRTEKAADWGKMLLLSAEVSPELLDFSARQNAVLLLCGTGSSELPTIPYSPADYETALAHLEL